MKLMKTTGLVAAALGLVALMGGEALAQNPLAPTLTVTANGVQVTIEWTALPGATSYTLAVGTTAGGSNIASINLPITVTRIVVNAPAGTYFMRVRGNLGNTPGPNSNEGTVTVGGAPPPGPCTPPGAPVVTATVNGGTVAVSWAAVPGAAGYTVQWSRFPGGTELTEQTAAAGINKYIGVVGTYYVRVVAMSACGNTSSAEVSFAITSLVNPNAPRTPNPPPGQIIPRATLGYAGGVINAVTNQFRGDFFNSCSNHVWLYRVVQALRNIDSRWGLNYVRGWAPRMSEDIIAYNPTAGPDEGARQVYVFDTIAGHCGPNPSPWFNDVTDFTWFGGPARDWSICENQYCAKWTLEPYLRAGFPGVEGQK